jgi:ATP-dependent helicase HrpA
LQREDGHVSVRLFRSQDAARQASVAGMQRLVELAIQKDLGWLEKDLRALGRFDALYAPLGSGDELRETALQHLRRHILPADPLPALTEAQFRIAVDEARRRLPGVAQQLIDRVGAILQIRQQVQQRVGAATGLAAPGSKTLTHLGALGQPAAPRSANPLATELTALAPARFLDRIPFERLPHLPRYLKALLIRAERAALNPLKDQERARQLAPYQDSLQRWDTNAPRSAEARRQLEEFRWMIDEYNVSLFAQELGTAAPVSPKRLDQQLERIRQAG